ncbi:hypothetical protein ACT3S7_14710 [Corynebacterium sp. AOP34-AQ2-28]|uniref:hypothetical protein n=1 Tax=Corynebacterium sp. AOP34-AQ2-28 TaxID=3457689 RepID=UPI003FDB293B
MSQEDKVAQHNARVRRQLMDDFTALTLGELAQRRGEDEATAWAWAEVQNDANKLILVTFEGELRIPSVQLTDRGDLRDEIWPLVQRLRSEPDPIQPWQAWWYLQRKTGHLSGRALCDVVLTDPPVALLALDQIKDEAENRRWGSY